MYLHPSVGGSSDFQYPPLWGIENRRIIYTPKHSIKTTKHSIYTTKHSIIHHQRFPKDLLIVKAEPDLIRSHERCWLLKTAGRWPWKSESAKECVTTHLPKQLALKMDGDGIRAPLLFYIMAWSLSPPPEDSDHTAQWT